MRIYTDEKLESMLAEAEELLLKVFSDLYHGEHGSERYYRIARIYAELRRSRNG